MSYESLLDKLMDDDNHDNIELVTQDGNKVSFEQIALVSHRGTLYALLHPVEFDDDQVLVFKLNTVDEESIDLVLDEQLANEVIQVYNEDTDEDDKDYENE